MKKGIALLMALGAVLLLAGTAGAAVITPQTLLPGACIPQFWDALPEGVIGTGDGTTGISVYLATDGATANYTITMEEFQSQILPKNGWTAADVPGCPLAGQIIGPDTGSLVWGYLIDTDTAPATAPFRQSYLGPVVVAKRGQPTNPLYRNSLPWGVNTVQNFLPVDPTLDWADPAGVGCIGPPPLAVAGDCASNYFQPQPAVPHIHGGEVAPAYDGGPDAWWLPVNSIFSNTIQGTGAPANATLNGQALFHYPNDQQAGTIWFHDHALGITRLNVYAGMAGLYPIIDPPNEPPQATAESSPGAGDQTCDTAAPFNGCLPKFPEYDIPLIIQDRSFDINGQIYYNLFSNPQPNPLVHPFWIPEFIGDAIVVNGKTWPYLNVEPRQYRFRLVNGSNARFYDLTLNYTAQVARGGSAKTRPVAATLNFHVIATDDGYLDAPVPTTNLIIGPGERYEIIVNFADQNLPANATITMMNAARTPYPGGAAPVAGTTDRVMQFRVNVALDTTIADATLPTWLRDQANNKIVNITAVVPAIKRQLTLNEVIGAGGPLELVLNNTKYNGIVPSAIPAGGTVSRDSEQPQVGATELWEIINITADAHPIHTHLASFQIVSRQPFRAAAYTNFYASMLAANNVVDGGGPPLAYLTLNADGAIGGNPAIGPYLQAKKLTQPLLYENGWKDTAIMYPGEVTRIMIRWAKTDVLVPAAGACTGSGTPPGSTDPDGCPGKNTYPFNPTQLIGGVGYVWHCHIIDHEDNEMMRPYVVRATPQIP